VRILIADEHPIVRRGIRGVIETRSGWSVCGEAEDASAAIELALRERPDVAVIDFPLSRQNGLCVTTRLKASLPNTEVLFFTMRDDHPAVASALAAGARGYLLKSEAAAYLIPAISAVAAHRAFFSPIVSEMLLDTTMARKGKPAAESFTARELEVMQWVCEGESNSQIAKRLGVSVKTIESHRAAAMRKAGVHAVGELVRFAMKNRLVAA
jgi:DNA-binding NarL/FixJ family response regulator